MPHLRLFIAVHCPPPPAMRAVLASLERLRPAVNAVHSDRLHLTLRFLGDTPRDRLAELADALDRAVAGAGVAPFVVNFVHLGRFPPETAPKAPLKPSAAGSAARHRRPPRVLFAVPEDARPLIQLAAALDRELAALRPPIPPEGRPFTAHLTLARIKSPPRAGRRARRAPRYQREAEAARVSPLEVVDRLLPTAADVPLGEVRIEAVHLIASDLTPAGPVYTLCHTTPLPAGEA